MYIDFNSDKFKNGNYSNVPYANQLFWDHMHSRLIVESNLARTDLSKKWIYENYKIRFETETCQPGPGRGNVQVSSVLYEEKALSFLLLKYEL